MIIPRNNIPYKYLHELIANKFTIYLRSKEIQIDHLITDSWFARKNSSPTILTIRYADHQIILYNLVNQSIARDCDINHYSEVSNLHISQANRIRVIAEGYVVEYPTLVHS